MASEEVDDGPFIHAFVGLQATGAIGLCIILLTALSSKRIQRDLTWYNFCIAWIISCISYLLLSFAGQQTGPAPNHVLCLTQASLIYAAPNLTAFATLALVIQLWLNVHSAPIGSTSPRHRVSGLVTLILLSVPYAVAIVTLVASLMVASHWPGCVSRAKSSMYCGMNIRLPGQVSAILVAVSMGVAVFLEVFIAVTLYRNWRLLKSLDGHIMHSMRTSVRVGIFSLFSILSIAVAPVYLSAVMAPIPNIIIALTPVAAFFVFGSQKDLLSVWIFWRRVPSSPLSDEHDCDITEMLKTSPSHSPT
ncbi:G-protein coupled receptors family 3 profile domain-containing protein [Pleurotus pulmonarius]